MMIKPIVTKDELLVIILAILQTIAVNFAFNEPYMDEPFHYNQAVAIADKGLAAPQTPGLTTFRGYHWILSLFVSSGVGGARIVSCLVVILCQILACRGSRVSSSILLYPVHFFYNSLLYTDGLSTGLVTLAWALSHDHTLASGIVSGLAVCVRQSNIAFAFALFLKCTSVRFTRSPKPKTRSDMGSSSLLKVKPLLPFVFVGVGFAVFLVKNRFKIAIGHQEFHEMSVHLAQVIYLGVAIFGTMVMFHSPKAVIICLRMHWRRVMWISPILAFCGLWKVAHPFLLSDNRHLTFYLWKYLAANSWVLCTCGSIIASAGYVLTTMAFENHLEFAYWLGASLLYIVPSPLFELRYFNPSILVLLATLRSRSNDKGIAASAQFSILVALNTGVLLMFCTAFYKGIHFMY